MKNHSHYPQTRLRRVRKHEWSRRMVAENNLTADDLIWPVFVQEGTGATTPIDSMPGVFRYSIDALTDAVKEARDLGIPAIAIFPETDPAKKTDGAEEAINQNNLVCRTVAHLKQHVPDVGLICDVALDPYTSHGQDGLVIDGDVANDPSVEMLCQQAVVQAAAGCDVIAPSDMMDGRIGAIRTALDGAGYEHVLIMAYAAKYASAFYGPFRDAIGSKSNLSAGNVTGGGKKTYQMNPANSDVAMREIAMDIDEGADFVMVKPGCLTLI